MDRIAPSEIRFTQDNIGSVFRDGRGVNRAIEEIESGRIKVENFPAIRVARKNNKYYSLDNRRLYVFRVLEKRGLIRTVPVVFQKHYDKFTTINDGRSIYVRGEVKTYDHEFDNLQEAVFAPYSYLEPQINVYR